MKKVVVTLLVLSVLGAAVLLAPAVMPYVAELRAKAEKVPHHENDVAPAPAVTVIKASEADFTETVAVSGSLVPRDEILVAPEVEGFRVLELMVDEGDRVKKGAVLATLVQESLDAQLAQNEASLARAEATISQKNSQIVEMRAKVAEAEANFERAKPLKTSGYLSGTIYDQREAAAKTAAAQLQAAEDGLKLAEAEKKQVEAQRRELNW